MPTRQTLPAIWLITDSRLGAGLEAAIERVPAGDVAFARRLGATMVHNPEAEAHGLLVSRSVHSHEQAIAARDADLVFVSPVHASVSHRGGAALGLTKALDLARTAEVPAIALGGMDRKRGAQAMAAGFHGWAGIDAFLRS